MWMIVAMVSIFSVIALGNKENRNIAVLGFVFFTVLYSCRGHIGTDVAGYEYYYNNVNNASIVRSAGFEIGYFLLSKLFNDFGLSYMSLQFAVSMFAAFSFLYATSQYTKNYGIAFLVGTWFYFYPSIEIARQIICVAIFYISLKYIKSNGVKYCCINIIGLLFHRTAIIGLAFFAFYKNKYLRYICIIGMMSITALRPIIEKMLSISPMLLAKYQWYFVNDRRSVIDIMDGALSVKTLEYIVWFGLMLFLGKRKKKMNMQIEGIDFENSVSPYEVILKELFFFGLCIQVFIGSVTDSAYRFLYYTDIGFVMGTCFFYNRIKRKSYKFIYVIFLTIYICLRFYKIILANPELFG